MTITKRNDSLFIITQFLYSLVFCIPIWIVYYQERITVPQISFLIAFQYAIQLILELPTGALADLIGRKWTIALGYLVWAISSAILIFSHDFTSILIAAGLGGLGEALLSGSLEALVYDSHKQAKTEHTFSKVLSTNGILFQVGLIVATISGGYLYQIWPQLPYAAYVVVTAIAAGLSLFFIEPKIDTEHFSLKNYWQQIKLGTHEAFKSRTVALMSLFYIVVSGITWTNNLYFFEFILVELKLSVTERSWTSALIRLINISILRTLLNNEKLFTRERSIVFFPLMMLICFLPGVFFNGWWALPLIAGAVMAGTARWIILTRYTNELFESKYRATAISALSMAVGIIFIIITGASGPIIERFGVRTVYTLLGILGFVLVLPLAVLLIRNERQKA